MCFSKKFHRRERKIFSMQSLRSLRLKIDLDVILQAVLVIPNDYR